MADTKISALTSASALGGTEIFPGVQSAATVGVTATQLKTFVIGAGSVSVASGKTLTANNSITLAGTDSTTMTFPSSSATLAGLGIANVFTTLQTITIGAANTGVLASTGYSLTGSDATVMVNLAGTWNTTGTPSAIKLNITNTASNPQSRLLDLQVGGTYRAYVDVGGAMYLYSKIAFGGGAGYSQQFLGATGAARLLDSDGNGTGFRLKEVAATPTGVSNEALLYAIDNGSGKTQLMVIFGSGAAQQVAIEP